MDDDELEAMAWLDEADALGDCDLCGSTCFHTVTPQPQITIESALEMMQQFRAAKVEIDRKFRLALERWDPCPNCKLRVTLSVDGNRLNMCRWYWSRIMFHPKVIVLGRPSVDPFKGLKVMIWDCKLQFENGSD